MKMNDAAMELDYRGTFVYVKQNQIEVMRVVHQSQHGVIRERIYSLNGAPREIVRDAEQVWCYLPDRRMGVHEYRQVSNNNFPHILPKRLDKLENNYRITMGGKGRIADRNAVQIWILPRDEYRYGHDLWVDEESGLLLKASLMDRDSEPIEQYMFTDIQIGEAILESDLAPLTPRNQLVWYGVNKNDEPKNVGGDVKWEAAKYPDGFMLSRKIKRMSPMRNQMVQHLVYSDGLAAVSIFVEKLTDSVKPINGLNSMGAINAYGTVIDNHQVTVVGEVPSKTVTMIAMSVTRSE
jgi:sigma-E factor negative regulatory protein RseB